MTHKQKEIEHFKEELQNKSYTELNEIALEIGYSLIQQHPTSWKYELKTNKKHLAVLELMNLNKISNEQ